MNKKIPKRLLAVAMAAMTAVTVSVPAFAENSIVNTPSNNEVQVQSSIASNFTVTIPKAVVLTKASGGGTGEYTAAFDATVTGDIGELETVYVTPDASVTLTGDKAGATTVATTTIGTTEFARAAILGQTATGTHNLTAQLTPGAWSGAMNVAISLKATKKPAQFDTTNAWMDYYTVNASGGLVLQAAFKTALRVNANYKDWTAGAPLPAIPATVTKMDGTFIDVKAATLDLSGWKTSNVTSMAGMFSNCASTQIDLSSFDMAGVTNTDGMFQGAAATVGYGKTAEDCAKLNASIGKPGGLTFVVKA